MDRRNEIVMQPADALQSKALLFPSDGVNLRFNGAFREDLVPYDFPFGRFAYSINNFFPLVMVHACRR